MYNYHHSSIYNSINVPFIGKFHNNCNIININHQPSQYLLDNNQWSSLFCLQAFNMVTNNRALLQERFAYT